MILVEADAHVKYYVGMTNLIDYFYLFDKVSDALFASASFFKPFSKISYFLPGSYRATEVTRVYLNISFGEYDSIMFTRCIRNMYVSYETFFF